MTKRKQYYLTFDCNGTEDEITIHAPDGKGIAFIWFWDEEDNPAAAETKANAQLIVDALNAYAPTVKKNRKCGIATAAMINAV